MASRWLVTGARFFASGGVLHLDTTENPRKRRCRALPLPGNPDEALAVLVQVLADARPHRGGTLPAAVGVGDLQLGDGQWALWASGHYGPVNRMFAPLPPLTGSFYEVGHLMDLVRDGVQVVRARCYASAGVSVAEAHDIEATGTYDPAALDLLAALHRGTQR